MPLKNLRRNPIDSSVTSATITDESHTVAELDFLTGVYGFILEERPIAGSVSVVTDNTAATPYTIVTTSPLPGQVFVDFNENRGICIFNSADDGDAVLVSYSGAGAVNSIENIKKVALETPLSDYVVGSNTAVANTDTLYQALGKFQGQINSSSSGVAEQTTAAPSKTTPVDADALPITDSAASNVLKKLTFANLFLWVISKIAALATKSTPVDADGLLVIDSAASNVGKFLSWANLKTTLNIPTVTAPASVTPTFTGFGTVSALNAYTWRVGAMLHFQVTVTVGTTTATEARMGLRHNPGSGEVDVTTASNYPTLALIGTVVSGVNTSSFFTLTEASRTYINFGTSADGSLEGLLKRQGTQFANGSTISMIGSVRIQGW